MEHSQWTGRTAGSRWMHCALMKSFRVLPLRFIYAGMAVFVIPFCMLFGRKGYRAIYHFFRQRMGYGPWRAFRNVYLNHLCFGKVVVDRFAAYAGKHFEYDLEGYNRFLELTGEESGFMVLSCHVGNYEIAGYAFRAMKKPMNALVFSGEATTVMEGRSRLLGGNNIHMIPVSDDMSHLFAMNTALSNGEILSIPGDRVFGSPRTVTCQFFGSDAKFPLGPYKLATARRVPVLAIYVMKESARRYQVLIRELSALDEPLSAEALAQRFATETERVIRQYPTQWFNFYEFWDA